MQRIHVIDSHTGGEPTRLVIDGFPEPDGATLAAQRASLERDHDQWRRACLDEPRGHGGLVGALLRPPVSADASVGVIFFNNIGYLGMCGHGLIGVLTSLAWLGRLESGVHVVDTPVGPVRTRLNADGSVQFRNVSAYRARAGVRVDVPDYGPVSGDVAWGGNWFFISDDHGQHVQAEHIAGLKTYALALRRALADADVRGDDGGDIDHVELTADTADGTHRNFVLCPGGEHDRSPCGTGTCAKLACLAADGTLAPGVVRAQAGITGSHFTAWYEADYGAAIVPTVCGRAYVTTDSVLLLDSDDPLRWGLTASA